MINKKIFQEEWWLDIVCQNGYDKIEHGKTDGNNVTWFLPKSKKYGINFYSNPPLTPYLGPIFSIYSQKESEKRVKQIELLEGLINCNEFTKRYVQQFIKDELTVGLTFKLSGFHTIPHYTFQVSIKGKCRNEIETEYRTNTRRIIKRAKDKLEVKQCYNFTQFYDTIYATYHRQNKKVPYPKGILEKLFMECVERNNGRVLGAYTTKGILTATAFLVWDEKYVYYLCGGAHPEFRDFGGQYLLMHESIAVSMEMGLDFDFVGSEVPSIGAFFRGFGAEPTVYFQIKKKWPFKLL